MSQPLKKSGGLILGWLFVENLEANRYVCAYIESVAMEKRLGVYVKLFDITQGVETCSVTQVGASEMIMVTRATLTGDFHRYQFQFDPIAPNGIVSVAIDPIDPAEAERLMGSDPAA